MPRTSATSSSGYALGRSLLPTDRPLLDTIRTRMTESEGRLSAAVLAVVQSRQFLNRRNDDCAEWALRCASS